MNYNFIFIFMIFCHIINDFFLQGILAEFKQKSYWEKNAPDKRYKNDYIISLLMHSISWSFMIMLPLAINMDFKVDDHFLLGLGINVIIHAIIDHLKANIKVFNLCEDQLLHIFQIFITFILFI